MRLFRTIISLVFVGAALATLPGRISAEPGVDPTPPQAASRSPVARKALLACVAAIEPGNHDDGDDLAGVTAQLRNPDNRIEARDWSGQDLSAKNFSGKV